MATVTIGNRRRTFSLELDDEQAAKFVIFVTESFEKRDGVWLGGGTHDLRVDGTPINAPGLLTWVPAAEAEVTVRFDANVPGELSDYTRGAGR